MRVCGGGVVEVYFRLAARFDDDGPGAVREDAIAVAKNCQPDEAKLFRYELIDSLTSSHVVESYELRLAEGFLRH